MRRATLLHPKGQRPDTSDGGLAAGCSGSCVGLSWTASFASLAAGLDPAGVVKIPNFVNPSARNVALTAVHELGHVVGLAHTTATETANALWAPWMTAASRTAGDGAPLHQFIQSGPQDEYAVMAGFGLVPRADEPSPVVESGADFVASGVIASPTDQDSFQFTVPAGAGPTTITAVPAAHTSLDIAAMLYDSTMTPVATSNPPAARVDDDTWSGLDAAITATLTPGVYTLTVAGAGLAGVYSNYGSIGTYTVTTVTTPATGVSIGSGSVAEGDTGKPRTISFPVVLPAPATSTVTVQYSIEADGSGSAATGCTSAKTCLPGSGGGLPLADGHTDLQAVPDDRSLDHDPLCERARVSRLRGRGRRDVPRGAVESGRRCARPRNGRRDHHRRRPRQRDSAVRDQ